MKEKIDFSIRNSLKTSRGVKKESRENNVVLEGNSGKNIQEMEQQVSLVLTDVLLENQEWVDEQKREALEMLPNFDQEELLRVFQFGLNSFFKQQYKLFTEGQKTRKRVTPDILKNKEYIRQQIIAYTFDFIQLLKSAKKDGMSSIEALELAQLSHRYNPDIISKLTSRYPNISKWIIRRALIGYSRNPEKFIDDFMTEVERLKLQYPKVNLWVIHTAALKNPRNAKNPKGPETFIDSYVSRVEKLYKDYPDVEQGVIRYIALNNTQNSKRAIDNYIKKTRELISQYPSFSLRTVKHAVLHRPEDPEDFIKEYMAGKITDLENEED